MRKYLAKWMMLGVFMLVLTVMVSSAYGMGWIWCEEEAVAVEAVMSEYLSLLHLPSLEQGL